jgi:signal transduction histidine kinase
MTPPNGFASGLAFLPAWLADARDGHAWDAVLGGWVRAAGWQSAGVVWPLTGTPTLAQLVRPDGVSTLPMLPAELPDVGQSLSAGQPTTVWQVPGTSGRLYTLLQPVGRAAGLVWAERAAAEPWTEAERQFLTLSARLMERSPALAARVGPVLDGERLHQRLSDAAVIAGRMAHDFNNILTGIIGFSDLTTPLVQGHPQAVKFVTEIGKVGQRGMQFTQQLHQFSRSGQAKPQPGQLPQCLAKEEARVRATSAVGVQVRTDVPTACALVALEAGPLAAVLGHLLDNAAEVSPPHGTIRVTARPVELTAADARGYLGRVAAGPHVEVTIQDEGPGIKPDVRAKLFAEPFFTTKVRHRGLGLATVFRTLHAHAGGIRIDAVPPPGTGTAARVVLPVAARPPITTPRPTVITTKTAV